MVLIFSPLVNVNGESDKIIPENKKIITDTKPEGTIIKSKKIDKSNEVDDLIPQRGSGFSMMNTIILDVVLPGGGHYYRGDYYNGVLFMTLKLAGIYSIYHFSKEWEEAGDDYDAAKNSNLPADTLTDYERKYDRSAQYLFFAVFSSVLFYSLSIFINYKSVKKMNSVTYPAFEFSYSKRMNQNKDNIFILKYNYRF